METLICHSLGHRWRSHQAVTAWLDGAEGVSYEHVSVSNLKVTATAAVRNSGLLTHFLKRHSM